MNKLSVATLIGRIFAAALSGIVGLAALILYILTSSSQFLFITVIAVVCAVFGAKAKSKWLIAYIVGGIILLLYMGFTGSFSSDKAFQYPFQKWYAHEKGGFDVTFLPDELPDTVYSYSTEFMPSVLQGSGYYSVFVETDAKTVADVKNTAEKRAMEILPLTECMDEYTIVDCIKNDSGSFCYVYDDAEKTGFYVYVPIEAIKNADEYCVYVAYTDYDFNHPDTRAYIISESSNAVVWSII